MYILQHVFCMQLFTESKCSGFATSAPGRLVNYFLVLMLFLMPFLAALMYALGRCDLHYLAPVLPTCSTKFVGDGDTPAHTDSILSFLTFILIQIVFVTQMLSCSLIYVSACLPIIFAGLQMITDLV